jgi:hypothetical protein
MAIWEQVPWPASTGEFATTSFREREKCVAPVSNAEEGSFSLWHDLGFWLAIASTVAFWP